MRVVVIEPPQPVLDLAEVKQHLKVDGDEEDTLIAGMIAAAQDHIDGPGRWLGRSIGVQTIEVRADGFCGAMRLPYGPVIEVLSVGYVGADGADAEVDASGYALFGGSLEPAFGASWPTVRSQREAVRVRYTAGYAVVPPAVLAALKMMVHDMYHHRGSTVSGVSVSAVPMSVKVESLLHPYWVLA